MKVVEEGLGDLSENIRDIVERCRPAVESVVRSAPKSASEERLLSEAVRANVRYSCNQLRHGSRLLEQFVEQGRVVVVGAEYSLETGEVTFFDEPAAAKRRDTGTQRAPTRTGRISATPPRVSAKRGRR